LANTGGGGGGTAFGSSWWTSFGGAGGSGIVFLKYNQTFTANQVYTFQATSVFEVPTGVTEVDYLVVAGGGGGGLGIGGGGGGGGFLTGTGHPVTPGTPYTITVGAGGAGQRTVGPCR
jgi:hypothetical protein